MLWTCCGTPGRTAENPHPRSPSDGAGWRPLFDGKTLNGWRNYRQQEVGPGWQVVDGALTRVDDGAGDIITVEQFDRFELTLEYNIETDGNSGVMFHVTEDQPAPWQSGPEIQIRDDAGGRAKEKSGWLYQLYPSSIDASRPSGQWNDLRILVTPDQCVTYLNGIVYARYTMGSDDWNRRVARSKFASFPRFGKAGTGHICLQDHGSRVAFRNIRIRRFSEELAANDRASRNLSLRPVRAFPNLAWTGWTPFTEEGKPQPLRPILLTHAADGSNRVFVVTQQGVIHVFPNRDDVDRTEAFLDIRDRTFYADEQFERGLLGLAFHPRYRENGEFFICYTTPDPTLELIVSRFHVRDDDPNCADADSEVVLLRIPQPFWNHNGGTILFGPDGFLYLGLGDGGSANDPLANGQNLGTLLGSILRIDVDRAAAGRPYAIPPDNPFVNREGARGEIWAYGLRNVWRMALDRQTGLLWAADVGQDLFEEINIIHRGGNYGWSVREGRHRFGRNGSTAEEQLIEPVWEYDHHVGKSITGGLVYRGARLPQLQGCYVYADFVSGGIWALRLDRAGRKVVENLRIPAPSMNVTSFGDDEAGELYFTVVDARGHGLYRFEPSP
jgi:glucose/arabinose dehydrogenase